MPQEYGAFQPMVDLARKYENVYNKLNQPMKSPFESQHDKDMDAINKGLNDKTVQDANASYRKTAPKKLTVEGPKLGQKKAAKKKSAKKQAAKKR